MSEEKGDEAWADVLSEVDNIMEGRQVAEAFFATHSPHQWPRKSREYQSNCNGSTPLSISSPASMILSLLKGLVGLQCQFREIFSSRIWHSASNCRSSLWRDRAWERSTTLC